MVYKLPHVNSFFIFCNIKNSKFWVSDQNVNTVNWIYQHHVLNMSTQFHIEILHVLSWHILLVILTLSAWQKIQKFIKKNSGFDLETYAVEILLKSLLNYL